MWLINATEDYSALAAVCAQARQAGQTIHVLYRRRDREAVRQAVPAGDDDVRLIELDEGGLERLVALAAQEAGELVFLPCVDNLEWTDWPRQAPLVHAHCLQPLVATPSAVNPLHYRTTPVPWFGWRAGREVAVRLLREPSVWQANGLALIEAIQGWPDPPRWQSIPLRAPGSEPGPRTTVPRLTLASSVLAVISFYGCEAWLHACLTSMNQQTRPPENIVVIDDCSPALPLPLLAPFPNVTLLSTTRNVGPEKILNNIIAATDYAAYLVQDADDWSAHDRLELSLRAAEQTGADMVGTHEFSLFQSRAALELCVYPPDVNHAMAEGMGHHLMHPTSLISRSLALNIGGFDEQLKLGADTDFIARAWHAGRIVNLPGFGLFHRIRAGSLTTNSQTGHQSVARKIEAQFIMLRARRNLELVRAGRPPNIIVKQKEPIGFIYHQGPKLRLASGILNGATTALTSLTGH
jgi:GT2 family glycosyltransferase